MAKDDYENEPVAWIDITSGFPSQFMIRKLMNRPTDEYGVSGHEMFSTFFLMLCYSIPHKGELRDPSGYPLDIPQLAKNLSLPEHTVACTCKALMELCLLSDCVDGVLRLNLGECMFHSTYDLV